MDKEEERQVERTIGILSFFLNTYRGISHIDIAVGLSIRWFIFDQPVVIPAVRVPDYVVQDH